jgi:predicted dehydrogenase
MKGRALKFLVVGLGSMGKRRIRNLKALGELDIVGCDPRADRRDEVSSLYGVRTCDAFDEGLAGDVDAVLVCTPPDSHTPYALPAVAAGKHLFMEAGVPDDGLATVDAEATKRGVVVAPSCTMRFHPAIRKAKEIIDSGKVGRVAAFTHHFGEHLPRWHPWEDYRNFYISKRVTGACREIVPFELVWLTWLCGEPTTITALTGRVGDLDSDIDDVYQILLRFSSGCLGHLQVDALQMAGYRQTRFVCTEGVVAWDWDARHVRVFSADGSWREYPDTYTQTSTEGFYIDETAAFVAAVRGESPWPHSLTADRRILDLLLKAEESSASGRHFDVTKP